MAKIYAAIDLKSFYASVECVKRGLDPLDTNLVVADKSRTEKTICLAVTPPLKSYGISGRSRLFEVVQKVREINGTRRLCAPNGKFDGKSYIHSELLSHPEMELDYIAAPPRMSEYMRFSTNIYNIYLRYIAPEDIHVYSVDEVFIDITPYLASYNMTARELVMSMIRDVFNETGITATAGIGTNLYLCKVAMDIVAKKCPPDKNGVRIAELDEMSYRKLLWDHRPLTDFWRIGRGYSKTLEKYGLYTMGDIARCSVGNQNSFYSENLLYKLFGVNAELLIDHAWGWEPCTISDIKAYRPSTNSLSTGQVLKCPYDFEKARLVISEMAERLSLDLVEKNLVTDQITITVGYDIECLKNAEIRRNYKGTVTFDIYGRSIPKHSHGTENFDYTSSSKAIIGAVLKIFDNKVNRELLIRRLNISANRIISMERYKREYLYEQMNFFTDINLQKTEEARKEKELSLQRAILSIEKKYGKNSILKGMNLKEGATMSERNAQIGGHKA